LSTDSILIRGAREHNLKNLTVELPREKLIVFTGLSGSGKSSLAFDTIYAEGQRRYVESLSAYARQFLGQMDKPDVDFIEGLSPAISIDQKTSSRNPRSTVGTVTEVHDYLRLLYARIRSSTVSSSSKRAPGSRFSLRWCGVGRASSKACSKTWPDRVSPE
jgi:excinuclease ABC subunit A